MGEQKQLPRHLASAGHRGRSSGSSAKISREYRQIPSQGKKRERERKTTSSFAHEGLSAWIPVPQVGSFFSFLRWSGVPMLGQASSK